MILAPAAAILLFASAPAAARTERWAPKIGEASARFGIPGEWIRKVMAVESGGRTLLAGRPITSGAGAMGLMQLMPSTWSDVRAVLGLGSDPFDPRDNIIAGTFYLRALYDRFGYPGLFAAYNAGPARYSSHLAKGVPLPRETRSYLAAVAGAGAARVAQPRVRTPGLFAFRAFTPGEPPKILKQHPSSGLFVVLGDLHGR